MGNIFYNDYRPINTYLGDTKIQGYTTKEFSGTERVGFESIYNAQIPSVKIFGDGYQKTAGGKNECVFPYISKDHTENGVQYTIQGNTITAKGTATGYSDFYICNINVNRCNGRWICCSGVDPNRRKNIAYQAILRDSSGNSITTVGTSTNTYFLIDLDRYPATKSIFLICKRYNNIETDFSVTPQIEYAESPTTYEPYITAPTPEYPIEPKFLENAEIRSTGRNLIPFPYRGNEGTFAGITYSVDGQGIITMSGTATGFSQFIILRGNFPKLNGYIKLITDDKNNVVVSVVCKDESGNWQYVALINEYTNNVVGCNFSRFPKNADVQISIKPSRQDGTVNMNFSGGIEFGLDTTVTDIYEPYFDGGVAQLPILRAIPGSNIKDEIDVTNGVITRKVGCLDIVNDIDKGSLKIDDRYVEKYDIMLLTIMNNLFYVDYYGSNISNYINGYYIRAGNKVGSTIGFENFSKFFPSITTANQFEAWLRNASPKIKIWYTLKTPITEHFDKSVLKQQNGFTQILQEKGEIKGDIKVYPYIKDMGI